MTVQLTLREKQILKLIAGGLSNKEISCDLKISESTTENHIHNLYRKLNISKRSQAIIYFFSPENLDNISDKVK